MAEPFEKKARKDGKKYVFHNEVITLYQYDFPKFTTLVEALEWTLKHSYQEILRPSAPIGGKIGESVSLYYREVVLIWQLSKYKFIANTINRETGVFINPEIKEWDRIVVAHTHPTPKDLPANSSTDWKTQKPSPEDIKYLSLKQTYSIILHRDPMMNQIPWSFIYSKGGQQCHFQNDLSETANTFLSLEKAATAKGKEGYRVGNYPKVSRNVKSRRGAAPRR